jgi:serine/threonine-protein kinase
VTPVVKVIDFGIAKATGGPLTDKTVYTALAQMVGTPLYMSPEQAGLSDLDVDTRSEVYSLGVLLYELLTGTTPFESEALKKAGYDEMRRMIREEEPPRPSARLSTLEQARLSTIAERRRLEPHRLNQQVRGELDWMVMKELEKDRGRRYESASALAADFRRYLNDEPVAACPPSKTYRLRKFVRRHKAGFGMAAVLLLGALLAGGSGLWWAQKRAGAAGEARAALREARGLLEEERWYEALSAAQPAEGVLAGVGADTGLRREVRELIKDLQMAGRLQEAQLLMTLSTKEGLFDYEASVGAYADAFREYGLDVDGPDPQAVAEQIRTRPIQRRLVAALVDWAFALLQLRAPGWQQPLAVARAADPDGWRNRLRDGLEGKDPTVVEELADADVEQEWPVPTLELLARLAMITSSGERVAVLLARAQQRHPVDFWVNQSLLVNLWASRPRHLEEMIRYASVLVALQPKSPGTHVNLGNALHVNGQLDEAIAEYREAIRLKKDYPEAHSNLGSGLYEKGRLDEAEAEFREALRLKKDDAMAHTNLRNALRDKGQLDEAIAEYREAIRLKKDYPLAHKNLGAGLGAKGQLDEAIAEYREAIRLHKGFVQAHNNLGSALKAKGQLDEAIAEFREALRLKPSLVQARANLRDTEQLARLEARLPALLQGKEQPKDAAERLALASFCQRFDKQLHATEARWYAEAFAAQPSLADDLSAGSRYNAACAAALAGCGQGKDAAGLDDKERGRLRRQALDWLKADLRAWRRLLDKEPDKAGPAVGQQLQHWLQDTDFNGVRGAAALAKLPEAERPSWQQLWADVADTLARSHGQAAPKQKPQAK